MSLGKILIDWTLLKANEHGLILKSHVSNSLQFTCSFHDSISTDDVGDAPTYVVNRKEEENVIEIEQLLKWEDFSLTFFQSDAFENAVTDAVDIGTQMFMQAKWTNEFKSEFPVRFYIDECRVSANDAEFKVIENGCGNSAVETTLLTDQFRYEGL